MAMRFVLAVIFVLTVLLLKDIIDVWRECKRRKRLDLYRRAELIGRKRHELSISERSKTQS
ncbi:MAG: hypothetical protein HZB85_01735 [Deltaproteobacteria bacterium]|nr:hypothetical protein [Deltaproteobacteria bacterium]